MPRFLGMTLVTGLICALPVAASMRKSLRDLRRLPTGSEGRDQERGDLDRPDRTDQGRRAQAVASDGDLELPD